MRPYLPVLCLLVALGGCSSAPAPARAQRGAALRLSGDRGAPPPKQRVRTGTRPLRVGELLPIPLDKVLWYRASFPSASPPVAPRQVAMFAVRDPEVGRYLETVGLGKSRLRLLHRARQVWLVPASSGLSNPSHFPATMIYEEGEATEPEALTTALGRVRAQRIVREEEGLEARFWFVKDIGLVRHELVSKGAPVFRLDLLAVLPRGRPRRGYDCSRPGRMWNALQEAIRRLDVASLPAFLTRAMQARVGTPDWQATSRMAQALRRSHPIAAERIRRVVPDLLDVRLDPSGPWTVDGDRAEAPAKLRARFGRTVRRGAAVIELRRGADGNWRWDGFRHAGEPRPGSKTPPAKNTPPKQPPGK